MLVLRLRPTVGEHDTIDADGIQLLCKHLGFEVTDVSKRASFRVVTVTI
jgi:hypothetical protein